MAVDKRTGTLRWKTLRPEAKSGHATPIVWRAPDGRDEILLPGSFLLTAYDAATGAKRWWVRGLSFEIKSTPVVVRRHDLHQRLWRAAERSRTQGQRAARQRNVEDGRRRRQRRDVERRVSQARPQLVRDGRPRRRRVALAGRMGVLPRRARLRERHARDSARRSGRHDGESREVEVPALGAAAAVAALLSRRALHGERRRHRHDAQPEDRRA